MFFPASTINQYIIQVDHNKFVKVRVENAIDDPSKSGKGVGEGKRMIDHF